LKTTTLPDATKLSPQQAQVWRLLLVDDDPIFAKIMQKTAAQFGLELRAVHNMKELSSLADLTSFDVVLMDYNLDGIKGSTLSRYLSAFFPALPVVMVSTTSTWWHQTGANWPLSVRKFVHKDRAPLEVLVEAVEVARRRNATEEGMDGDAASSQSSPTYKAVMGTAGSLFLKGQSFFVK
jgi:DNA-binding response OmpR family regulator